MCFKIRFASLTNEALSYKRKSMAISKSLKFATLTNKPSALRKDLLSS